MGRAVLCSPVFLFVGILWDIVPSALRFCFSQARDREVLSLQDCCGRLEDCDRWSCRRRCLRGCACQSKKTVKHLPFSDSIVEWPIHSLFWLKLSLGKALKHVHNLAELDSCHHQMSGNDGCCSSFANLNFGWNGFVHYQMVYCLCCLCKSRSECFSRLWMGRMQKQEVPLVDEPTHNLWWRIWTTVSW